MRLFLLLMGLLTLTPAGWPEGEVIEVHSSPDGQPTVTLVIQQGFSTRQVLERIAQLTGQKLDLLPSLASQLEKIQAICTLRQKPLDESLEYLVGAAGYSVSLQKKRIVVFQPTQAREWQRQALSGFQRFLVVHPTHANAAHAYFALGTAQYFQREWALALSQYQAIFEQFAESEVMPQTVLLMARCFIELGESSRAQTTLHFFIDRFREDPQINTAFTWLGLCLAREGNLNEAHKVFEYLLQLRKPGNPRLLKYLLAKVLREQGKLKEALGSFVQLLHDPQVPPSLQARCHLAALRCLLELGRVNDALAHVAFFVHQFPSDPLTREARLAVARVLQAQERYLESHYLLWPLLGDPPAEFEQRRELYLLAGENLVQLRLLDEAAQMYATQLARETEVKTGLGPLLMALGNVYLQARRWENARQVFQLAAAEVGETAYLKQLECRFAAQEYQLYRQEFFILRSHLQSAGVKQQAMSMLGDALMRLGRRPAAIQAYRGIVETETELAIKEEPR